MYGRVPLPVLEDVEDFTNGNVEFATPDWADAFPADWRINTHRYNDDDLSTKYGPSVREALEEYKGARILDVGCESTTGVPAIAGEENTVVQLEFIRERLDYGAELKDIYRDVYDVAVGGHEVQADACTMPFPDDSFDIVFAGAFLEPRTADAGLLQAYHDTDIPRVLRPGGDLIITAGAHREAATAGDLLTRYGIDPDRFAECTLDGATLTLSEYHPADSA